MSEAEPKGSPEEVREAILSQHEGLRARLERLEQEALEAVSRGDDREADVLRERLASFLGAFDRHLRFEERVLVPVIREIDAWGAERVEAFYAEHERQREILNALLADSTRSGHRGSALMVLGFVRLLEIDMAEEEAGVLSPELLRDDPVVTGEPD